MKKALIFIGGSAPEFEIYKPELDDCSLLIAADSGYDLALRDHIDVDLLIGDMDSINEIPSPEIPIDRHPEDKDFTDTELAIAYVRSLDERYEIVLIGGGEGRFDHTMSLISLFMKPDPPVRWYTAFECLHFLRERKEYSLCKDTTVSLMGLAERPVRVNTKGLFWELDSFELDLSRHSISNRTVADHLVIEPEDDRGILVGIAYPS